MSTTTSYLGRSGLTIAAGLSQLRFSPDLMRERVAFDAALRFPLRFREAISALHDVVLSDLRYQPRDKAAYEDWKRNERMRTEIIRQAAYDAAKGEAEQQFGTVSPELEQRHRAAVKQYWQVRRKYASWLRKNDETMWRKLMPYDPVVTVAEDAVLFECFSADESSYGMLSVDREQGFGETGEVSLGTTNVDYSQALYEQFQSLRSYRETRLTVDPAGFDVKTEEWEDYREEKIDLPDGWLRGFFRMQASMGLGTTRVTLDPAAVYSLIAWLIRHRARKSPRAIRFELVPGQSPNLVLEPWGQEIVSHGTVYDGPAIAPIRVWGRRRLSVLARALPLATEFDVHLLGTGLPSFWIAKMGEMRLTIGLSGWTANDWTRGSALDLLAPPVTATEDEIRRVEDAIKIRRMDDLEMISRQASVGLAETAAALDRLAHAGQVICDLTTGQYRYRQIVSRAVGESQIGPENEELTASREIIRKGKVKLTSKEESPRASALYAGKAEGKKVEVLLDRDLRIRRGACECGHHQRYGLRKGPCRHLLALRYTAMAELEVKS